MAAVRKRKRITPTLLTAPAGPDPSVTGAPLADVPTAVAVKFSTSQELEVVSKAVKQLQPLKAEFFFFENELWWLLSCCGSDS